MAFSMKKASFQEKERLIMRRKIEFLEAQFNDSTKRELHLQQHNQKLIRAIEELSMDKNRVLEMIEAGSGHKESQLEKVIRQKDQQLDGLRSRLNQSVRMNEDYRLQLRRKEQNFNQQIYTNQKHNERERCNLEKKIHNYQIVLRQFQSQERQGQLQELRIDNKVLKRKLADLSRNDNSQNNVSQIQLQSIIKNLDRKDTTFTLDQIENISFNRLPSQATEISSSKSRIAISRSKSGINDRLTTRSVISSLFCELCQEDYAPNEYYKHLSQHGQKGRLILQKVEIDNKLKMRGARHTQQKKLESELKGITVALKEFQRKSFSQSSRCLLR